MTTRTAGARRPANLSRAVAVVAEIALAAVAVFTYGALGALVELGLDSAYYVNAADHWRNGLALFGVLLLVAWGRSAHRRWFAVTQESGRWGQ